MDGQWNAHGGVFRDTAEPVELQNRGSPFDAYVNWWDTR